MMDWLAKMLKLPEFYLAESNGLGGGIIQGTASEAALVTMLAAKNKKVSEMLESKPDLEVDFIKSKLVIYCSEQLKLKFINYKH